MAAKKANDGVNVAAMQKIIALLKQRHEENGALIEELERLAGGGLGIGAILNLLYETWGTLWSTVHSGTYIFDFKKDAPNMKRLFRQLGEEELRYRMAGYMKDQGEWLVKNKHPFSVFVNQSNRYSSALQPSGAKSQDDGPAPADCKHTPPCKSDVEHTKRRQAENR